MNIESGISEAISFRALDYPRTSQRFFVVLRACFVFGNIAVFVILMVYIRGTASL